MIIKWLAPHPIENKVFCVLCNTNIRCVKTNLIHYSQRAKYIEVNCQNFNNNDNNSDKNSFSHKEQVKRAEIKLAAFFTEHNVAFYIADHLIPLLQNIFNDFKIANDLSAARSRCINIIKNRK